MSHPAAPILTTGGLYRLDPAMPLDQVVFAAVDVETTGGALARGDRVCEVAIVRAQGGTILDRWSTLVQPDRPMNSVVAAKTGIHDRMLRTAPRFATVAAAVRDRLQGAVFVAHGAAFDERFLRHELERAGYPAADFPPIILDTCRLAQAQYTFPGYKLAELSTHLRLPSPSTAHRALPDALQAWAVLWQMITDLRGHGMALRTLGDLLALQQTPARRPAPVTTGGILRPENTPGGAAGGVAARVARWQRVEQSDQQQLAELLAAWFHPWSQAAVTVAVPLAEADLVADVCIPYPMGWRLVHQMPQTALTPDDLAAQTRRLAAAGIDVVWWLGPAANTPANQRWCGAYLGWRGVFLPDTAQPFQLLQGQPGYESIVEADETDNAYTQYWRRLALVRYLELWQRVRPADFLRGLVGTPQLGRSVIGMIGAANARGTMQKRGDAWYPRELAALYPYRAQSWAPGAVVNGRTQARQRAMAGGQARGA